LVIYSRQAFAQTARLLIPVVLFVVVAAPYLLHLFGKNYASEASTLLRLLSLATLPQILTGLYLAIARIRRSAGSVVAVQASMFVISLALSYFFLVKFGITGVGIAWLISQTIMALVLYFTQLRSVLWPKEAE
jgi:O-antigen/teichoic acid export membrane protein